jgi:hypothetical protein
MAGRAQAAQKSDQNGPHWAATLFLVALISHVWTNGQKSSGSFLDGSLWSSINTDAPAMGSFWPFSLMLTMHVINSVRSNGGYWVTDVIACVFKAFGIYMMRSLLAGKLLFPFLWENNDTIFTLVFTCWYFVNHDVPLTNKFNVWNFFSEKIGSKVPLQAFMDLCTLGFNSTILINTAVQTGTVGSTFFNLPALGQSMFICVALACSSQFFDADGIAFNLGNSCGNGCARAAAIAFWCGTNGLTTLPIVGVFAGAVTPWMEGLFSGRANFLFSMILFEHLAVHLYPFERPDALAFDALYRLTGVTASGAGKEPKKPSDPKGVYYNQSKHVNAAVTLAMVIGLSVFCTKNCEAPKSPLDGALWTSIFSQTKLLHAHWPFSLMLTMHVINSARSNGGYWAADIVNCVFTAYGSYMMKDLLNGQFTMPFLFADSEAMLSLLLFCWYFVNHNIPFTDVNVWDTICDAVTPYLPLYRFMDLCTLGFNCTILLEVATAAQTANNIYNLPGLAAIIFFSVAVHCAGEFFTVDGITFNVGDSCTAACARAVMVAVWCGTNAFGSLPFIGEHVGPLTAQLEGYFGTRANFVFAMILLDELTSYLQPMLPVQLPQCIFDGLYTVTGLNNGSEEREANEGYTKKSGYDASTTSMITAFAVVALSVAQGLMNKKEYNFDSILDGSLWTSVATDGTPLHATYWPFSVMLTMHVINSARSNGGYWAADIVNCVFTAFGGYMMKDLLNGNYTMPFLFADNEACISLLVLCWYFVNHDIPFTGINLWKLLETNLNQFFPLQTVMDLCTLGFNLNVLVGAAVNSSNAGSNFMGLPAIAGSIFICILLHCSTDFFNADGLYFNIEGCSAACERAVIVGFWCGTNGLANLPVIGGVFPLIGVATSTLEGMFGGRANFLIAYFLFEEVAGNLCKHKRPHTIASEFLYNLTGISN